VGQAKEAAAARVKLQQQRASTLPPASVAESTAARGRAGSAHSAEVPPQKEWSDWAAAHADLIRD